MPWSGDDWGAAPSWDNKPKADTSFEDEWGISASKNVDAGAFEGDKAGGGDDACRNCGQSGHFSRNCPEPKKGGGGCFNCGEEGHTKAECTNPKVPRGPCRLCEKEGHFAADCPDKPPEICRNCKQTGHKLSDCKENRAIDLDHLPVKSPEDAWADLKLADQESDLHDLREAIQVYHKAEPGMNYDAIEKAFRAQNFNTYIIGFEKEVTDTFTLMDLNGKLDCKYHVGYFFSPKPTRVAMKDSWPPSPGVNLERLADAGIPVERGVPKCRNCDQLGHTSKRCPEEAIEREHVEVKCIICDEVGHRARDCTQERVDRFACRNCKQSGHTAKECPEPRSAEGVECKNCNETGHFARDCPKREAQTCRNCGEEGHKARDCEKPRVEKCRNCDEEGHKAKECPKPKDWSRVKCDNCGGMGHGRGRCKAPPKEEEENGAFDPGLDESGFGGGGGHNNAEETPAATAGDTGESWGNGTGGGEGW